MGKRVIRVDNDPDCLDVMREVLFYGGFEVCAEDGNKEMFTLINEHEPDVLLIDYLPDGINGGELCSQVKNDGKYGHLPVIIISAYPRVLGSLDFYGCTRFIAKPFDLQDLYNNVHELTLSTIIN